MSNQFVIGMSTVFLLLISVALLTGQDLLLESDKTIKNFQINSNSKLFLQTAEELCLYEGINKISDCIAIEKKTDGLLANNDDSFVLYKEDKLFHYKHSELYRIDTLPDLITTLAFSKKGLIVGTADGLYLIDDEGKMSLHAQAQNLFINNIHVTEEEHLFIATDNGLLIINSEEKKHSILKNYSISQSVSIDTCTVAVLSDEGEIIVASITNGDSKVIKLESAVPFRLVASQGQLFVLNSEGVFVLENNILQSVLPGNFENFEVFSNVLIVAKQNQLLTYDLATQRIYTSGKNFCLYLNETDDLWVGQNKRLSIYNSDGTRKVVNINSEKENLYISSVIVHEDKIFVGTMGEGLLVLNNKGHLIQKFVSKSKTNQNNVIQLKLKDKVLWVAYLNGVFTIDVESLSELEDYNDILQQNYLYCIHPVDDKRFYLGTSNSGLINYNDDVQSRNLEGKSIYSIAKREENIFVSTERSGVYRINGKLEEKIFEGNVVHALIPFENYLIINEKNAVNIYDLETKRLLPLDIDSLSNCQLNGVSENENKIAIAYENGILTIDKNRLRSLSAIRLLLNTPRQYNQNIPESKSEFQYNENAISFSYHPNSYFNNQSSTYKYRLIGQDSNWVATQQTSVDFYNLNPGKYKFEVSLGYTNNFVPQDPVSYEFIISKPFWEESWFRFLLLASILALAYLVVKRREKELLKEKELEQERLVFELEQIKKQIDPHFLFNSFNSLIGLIEENPKLAAIATENLSDFYREVTSIKNNDLIDLVQDLKISRDYFSIQKLRFEELITLNINVVNKEGKVIPLATQALIENAVKHNVINQNNSLIINITREGEYLVVSNKINSKIEPMTKSGLGLKNLGKRYKLLTDREMLVTQTDNSFFVKIPIIHD